MTKSPAERAKQYSKGSLERLEAMAAALRDADERGLEGDVAECGVWRGGHVMLARMISPHRTCWLYDTFAGMPPPGPRDMKRDGELASDILARKTIAMSLAPLDLVRKLFEYEGLLDDDLMKFVVGRTQETLKIEENLPKRIAVLRLDTDWYESTRAELETLYPRLVPGGHLIVDDYGHWLGARDAVDEYFGRQGLDVGRLRYIDYTAVTMRKESTDEQT